MTDALGDAKRVNRSFECETNTCRLSRVPFSPSALHLFWSLSSPTDHHLLPLLRQPLACLAVRYDHNRSTDRINRITTMPFASLERLEVPPLPSFGLESPSYRDQLVSSTILSSAKTAEPRRYGIEPLLQEPQDGHDPVLYSFAKRAGPYGPDHAPIPQRLRAFPLSDNSSANDVELDSSPGPSKRAICRSASDRSLSSFESSIWDDDSQANVRPSTVQFRGFPAKQRALDLAVAEAISSDTQLLLEAIHDDISAERAAQLQGHHVAPVHPTHHVLRSLVITATTGTSSDYFQWDAESASFAWAATWQHRKHMRRLRKLVKEQLALEGSLRAAGEPVDPQQQLPAAMTQPWLGTERIMGWSQAASDSVTRPFLSIGALTRRIDDRILAMHRSAAGFCNEAATLAAALDVVVTWFKGQLITQTNNLNSRISSQSAASSAILNALAALEPSFAVLKTLGNLLSCGQPRLPPFRPLTWLESTHATLSHLHAHLAASLASGAPPLPSAVLAYLLDRTSLTWRQQIARWVGYPGFESDRTGELDDRLPTFKAGSDSTAANVSVPWSGAMVDWSLDERGEEDIGYTLKPSAVPSFLPFRHARAFLEAGRALRLLKKAAPEDHPLVHQWTLHAKLHWQMRIELPTWRWSSSSSQSQVNLIQEHVAKSKREIAQWRRRRRKMSGAAMEAATNAASSPSRSMVLLNEPKDEPASETESMQKRGLTAALLVEDHFVHMSQLFTALPGVTKPNTLALHPNRSRQERALTEDADEEGALLLYLASAAGPPGTEPCISQASFDRITRNSLVAPFESWARLINMSLISVFFHDLGLATYLETCKLFLLLGSIHFERQVVSSLFDVDQASAFDNASSSSRAVVAMNQRLTAEGVWPPNDTLLSSALNTAVIETVSGMRRAHEDQLHRKSKTEDAVSLAFKDLDERLSFAIVEPRSISSSKAKGKPSWTDPSSIDALDWLTLSFHPPPLISPLLTQVAQSRYQRLWNMLLRIKRCKVAMKAAWACTFKSTSAAFTFDFRTRAVMQQFRWEANHFLDTFGSFVHEVGIESHWSQFMHRLEEVRKEVSDELSSRSSPQRARDGSAGEGESGDGDGDLDEETMEEEERAAMMTSSLELKDVFSLARYHEKILDRMLSTCLLKSKQRGVLAIINNLLQAVLDFAQLCVDFHTPATAAVEQPTFDDFDNLHRHFRSRMDTFVQALIILKDRRPAPSHASGRGEASSGDGRSGEGGTWGKRRQDVEAEKARLAEDELEDLRALDVDEDGRSVDGREREGASSVEVLLGRLNASGFYAELD